MSYAETYLKQADPVFAEVVKSTPRPKVWSKQKPFNALLESIVHQQLSVKAAASIWSRFEGLFPNANPVPAILLSFSDEVLRGAGLSRQKVKYVRSVAEFANQGKLDEGYLSPLDDETIISELTEIYGVGRWTVEMFLMSALAREDVFAPDDLIIQQAMQDLYGLEDLKGKKLITKMRNIADRWSPYRTLACQYLWAWKHAKVLSSA